MGNIANLVVKLSFLGPMGIFNFCLLNIIMVGQLKHFWFSTLFGGFIGFCIGSGFVCILFFLPLIIYIKRTTIKSASISTFYFKYLPLVLLLALAFGLLTVQFKRYFEQTTIISLSIAIYINLLATWYFFAEYLSKTIKNQRIYL